MGPRVDPMVGGCARLGIGKVERIFPFIVPLMSVCVSSAPV